MGGTTREDSGQIPKAPAGGLLWNGPGPRPRGAGRSGGSTTTAVICAVGHREVPRGLVAEGDGELDRYRAWVEQTLRAVFLEPAPRTGASGSAR